MTTLPDKPSDLIRLALSDLARCERSPKYEIDMGDWHRPNGKCLVCLAGSVMAKTLEAPMHKRWWPKDFPDQGGKLIALDRFRRGDVDIAFEALGFHYSAADRLTYRSICPYSRDPKQFRKDMFKLARDLEKAGY